MDRCRRRLLQFAEWRLSDLRGSFLINVAIASRLERRMRLRAFLAGYCLAMRNLKNLGYC